MTSHAAKLDVFVLVGSFFVIGLLTTTLPAALPELLSFYGLQASSAGVLFTAWGIGMILGAATGLIRGIRHHVRTTFEGALLLLGLLSYVMSHPLGLTSFTGLLIASGLASGVIITIGHQFISLKDHAERNRMLGMVEFGLSSGAILTPLIINSTLQASFTGKPIWSSIYAASAVICVAVASVIIMRGNVLERTQGIPIDALPQNISSRFSSTEPALIYVMAAFCVIAFVAYSIEYTYTYWIAAYASSFRGVDSDTGRLVLFIFLIGSMVSRSLLILLSRPSHFAALLVISLALLIALFAYIPTYRDIDQLSLVSFLIGLCVGILYPTIFVIFMHHFSKHGASLSFLGLLVGTIGAKATAALSGVVADAVGFGAVFYGLSALSTFSSLIFFMYINELNNLAESVHQ